METFVCLVFGVFFFNGIWSHGIHHLNSPHHHFRGRCFLDVFPQPPCPSKEKEPVKTWLSRLLLFQSRVLDEIFVTFWHPDTLILKEKKSQYFLKTACFREFLLNWPRPLCFKEFKWLSLGFLLEVLSFTCWAFWKLRVFLIFFFKQHHIHSEIFGPRKKCLPQNTHTHNLQLLPTHPVPPAENTVFGTPQNVASKHRTSGGICMSRVFPKTASNLPPSNQRIPAFGIFLPGWLCGVGSGQSSRGRTFGRSGCWSFGWGLDPAFFFVLRNDFSLKIIFLIIPSRELTYNIYPSWGKGKSSSKVPW